MSDTPRVGIAVWGLGPHAFKNILPAIEQCALFRLVGVCSRSKARREEAVQRWGGVSWERPAELLDRDDVDIVYVSTPTGLHFEHGMEVLAARKHLICEKSLTPRFDEAERMAGRARDHKLVLCEAFAFQFHPRFLAIQATIADPAFGAVLHGYGCFGLPPLEQPGFRTEKSLGGGALLDVGCYPLALMRALFGEAHAVLRARIPPTAGVDTSGDASLLFGGDIRADVVWGYDRAYAADLVVLGTKRSLYANRIFSRDTVADSVILVRDQFGNSRNVPVPAANGFVKMLEAVHGAVNDPPERERLVDGALAQARLLRDVVQCAT